MLAERMLSSVVSLLGGKYFKLDPTPGVTLPDPEGVDFYNERFKLYKEIQAALAPIYHKL